MSRGKPIQRIYSAQDKDIPPGFYRLYMRVTRDKTTIRMADSCVEVDDQRHFRQWDGSSNWEDLDLEVYAHSQLRGPWPTAREAQLATE